MKFKNFAKSELSSQLLVGGTSLDIQTGVGTIFPDTGSTNIFRGVIWGASFSTPHDDINREVVEAYRSSGDTFTIVRAQEGTTAKQWEIGDNFMLTITAGTLDSFTGDAIYNATEKTTPEDADEIGLIDSVTETLMKLTWANLKATFVADKKATGAEITTGTDDAKFVTPKALADATVGKLGAEWVSWSPTWTNLTVGNGTVEAYYVRIGKTVHFRLRITLGSTSSVGTSPTFSLPVPAIFTGSTPEYIGDCRIRDLSPANYEGKLLISSTTVAQPVFYTASGANVAVNGFTASAPITWATGDYFSVTGTYEAA